MIISSAKHAGALLLILSVALSNCGPRPVKKAVPPPFPSVTAPYDLRVEAGSGKATISWSVDRTDTTLISGYNIYLSNHSFDINALAREAGGLEPYNHTPFPGDIDNDIRHESFPIDNLVNGRTYYVFVRTVSPDGCLSGPSNPVSFTPLAHGEFVISSDHDAANGGFCFEREELVSARDARCDLYFYATQDRVGLSSPYRLSGGLRKSRLSVKGNSPGPDDDTIPISMGDQVALRTRYGRAELTIESIIGQFPDISAKVRYLFFPDTAGSGK